MLPISQQSAYVLSSLGYHNYEGFALNDDEKPRLADLPVDAIESIEQGSIKLETDPNYIKAVYAPIHRLCDDDVRR